VEFFFGRKCSFRAESFNNINGRKAHHIYIYMDNAKQEQQDRLIFIVQDKSICFMTTI
jgi:hypothetical protein